MTARVVDGLFLCLKIPSYQSLAGRDNDKILRP
nr:MAG TPA: protein of unknown function DUF236 [Caudoviricetes sp.]